MGGSAGDLNTGRKRVVGDLQDEEDDTVFRALVADCNSRQAIIRKTLSKMPARPRRSMEREFERGADESGQPTQGARGPQVQQPQGEEKTKIPERQGEQAASSAGAKGAPETGTAKKPPEDTRGGSGSKVPGGGTESAQGAGKTPKRRQEMQSRVRERRGAHQDEGCQEERAKRET
jgi:hypothetical protein